MTSVTPSSSRSSFFHRRVRNITAIQVRNLTPYPVRDAFASALSKPSDQPQFSNTGHLSDDLDVTLSRRRSRRISMNSVHTLRSLKSDEDVDTIFSSTNSPGDSRGRRRTNSRVSFQSASNAGQPSASSSTGHRPSKPAPRRASSIASSKSGQHSVTGVNQTSTYRPNASNTSSSMFLQDNSQTGLEKVLSSRLVETFITISVPPPAVVTTETERTLEPQTPRRNTPHNSTKPTPLKLHQRKSSEVKKLNGSPASPDRPSSPNSPQTPSRRDQRPVKDSPSTPARTRLTEKQPKSPSQSVRTPHPPHTPIGESSSPSSSSPQMIPNYISPIHRPSTNPSFPVNPNVDFGDWTQLSAGNLRIEIFGKVGGEWQIDGGSSSKEKGKGKQLEGEVFSPSSDEWSIVKVWDVDLEQMVPLPEMLAAHPSHLPSNSLVFQFGQGGTLFYLPLDETSGRSPSPTPGYSSDPELTGRSTITGGTSNKNLKNETDTHLSSDDPPPKSPIYSSHSCARTAGWQDLFKLVTLQSCIVDTEQSLHDVIQKIDTNLDSDAIFPLKREASEREHRISVLRNDIDCSNRSATSLREKIDSLKTRMERRRDMLKAATTRNKEQAERDAETLLDISDERVRLDELRSLLPPARTTLITILSSIFPIELLSPPDLLYTILDVPLPIPLSSNDAAPPLSLPQHKEVTEEAVAAGLGYAAQVLQSLSAYLQRCLIYPVTCVGSRSLIRDDISAMVGPRMFPLFSRGVDMYRFEYGVYLLNKNIEMLMIDRNLRALDMRHTLPNLKNLLLTLTADGTNVQAFPRGVRTELPTLDLDAISLDSQSQDSGLTESEEVAVALNGNGNGPPPTPASGSTTPTASADARKPRSFLGLTPFTGFLRSHYYPSPSGGSAKDADSEANGSIITSEAHCESAIEDDGEDRRTIRGVDIEVAPKNETTGAAEEGSEKKVGDEELVRQSLTRTAHIPSLFSSAG